MQIMYGVANIHSLCGGDLYKAICTIALSGLTDPEEALSILILACIGEPRRWRPGKHNMLFGITVHREFLAMVLIWQFGSEPAV